MRSNTVQYDDCGNFLLEGEVEKQWMDLHRDIQAQYRQERWGNVLKGAAGFGALVVVCYLAFSAVTLLMP